MRTPKSYLAVLDLELLNSNDTAERLKFLAELLNGIRKRAELECEAARKETMIQ